LRLLFSCYPGLGHLHPMLPLARAAVRAGHEVAFATGPDLAPRAQAYGFATWAVGLSSDAVVARYLERHPDSNSLPPPERLRQVSRHMFVDVAARSRVAEMLSRVRAWRPELILYDQSELSAPIAAVGTGTRSVVHSSGPKTPAAGPARPAA